MSQVEKPKKPYIYPHRHCAYCGRMIQVKGRPYCLKCKPEFEKQQSRKKRSKLMQRLTFIYIAAVVVVFAILLLFTHYS